ncbi:MAG: hypothetical protein O7D86_04735 [Proteobacteria bacterium]|nr:hypothetical protein [Pseudomonadota bacterium]
MSKVNHFIILAFVLLINACNTTSTKEESLENNETSSPTSAGQQTSSNTKQQTQTEQNEVNSQKKKIDENKTDDEILADALNELEKKEVLSTPPPQTQSLPEATSAQQDSTAEKKPVLAPAGSSTTGEQTQHLDQQLDDHFAEFDKLLLSEKERLSQEQDKQGAGGGFSSDDFGDVEGIDNVLLDEQFPVEADENSGQVSTFPDDNTRASIPPDLVNSKGDDIIARQLREAALKEKDPELKEKLWAEYRKYKKGIGRGR